MQRFWRRRLLILPPVAIGAALLALATAFRAAPERIDVQERAAPVRYVEVVRRDVTPRVRGHGVVAPARVWRVSAQVAGRVSFVHPNFVRGGAVEAGEVVLEIDKSEFELTIARHEASIAAIEAQIDELNVETESTRLSLAIEKDRLALERRELERQQALVERGAGAEASVDGQMAAVLAQRAAVQAQENQLRAAPARLKALEQELAVQRAELANAQLDLERAQITAPFAGRVAEENVELSQYAAIGAELGVVDGVEAVEIEAQFAPELIRSFAQLAFRSLPPTGPGAPLSQRAAQLRQSDGLRAQVSLALNDQSMQWPGRVERISDGVDAATRAIGVIVSVQDPYASSSTRRPPLLKDAFVDVELSARPVADLALAPRGAVENGEVLIIDEDDRLARRAIDAAGTLGDMVIITGGLNDGDRVIISPLSPAIDAMLLRPIRDQAAEARIAAAASGASGFGEAAGR